MNFSIKERMETLIQNLGGLKWPLDVQEEDWKEWTRDYAIILVSVIEPDDDVRRFFDLDSVVDQVIAEVKGVFKTAHVVHGGRLSTEDKKKPLILHVHRIAPGWDVELEVFRPRRVT